MNCEDLHPEIAKIVEKNKIPYLTKKTYLYAIYQKLWFWKYQILKYKKNNYINNILKKIKKVWFLYLFFKYCQII